MVGSKSNGAMDPQDTPQLFDSIDLCEELFHKFNYKIINKRPGWVEAKNDDWHIQVCSNINTNLIFSVIDIIHTDLVYDETVDLLDLKAVYVIESILEFGSEYWGCTRGCLEPKPLWSEASKHASIPELFSTLNHSECSGNCSNETRDKE